MTMKKILIGVGLTAILAGCNAGQEQMDNEQSADHQTVQSSAEVNSGNDAYAVIDNDLEEDVNDQNNDQNNASGNESEDANASNENGSGNIHEFELDLEFANGEEWEYEYEFQGEAEIEKENGESVNIEGQEAVQEIEILLSAVHIQADRTPEDMMNEVLQELNIKLEDIVEFDIEVEYETDEKVKFKYERAAGSDDKTVHDFSLDLEFFNGEEWEFDYERDDQEAEIERENGEETKVTGQDAMTEINALLDSISIRMDRSIEDMKLEVLDSLGLDPETVKEFDLDIEYVDHEEINIEHDLS